MTDLVFDIESTSLFKKDAPLSDASQPHIVQIAAHLYDGDRRRVGSLVTLIKPNGWAIEDGAEEVHGISTRQCAAYGVELVAALTMFKEMVAKVDGHIVAHNASFDRRMIQKSLNDLRAAGDWWTKGPMASKFFCTMEESAPVMQLPGKYGDWKYPRLEQAHEFFVPDDVTGMRAKRKILHDAENDILMTAQVFWGLQTRVVNEKR